MENYVGESGFSPLNQTILIRDQEQLKEENFPFKVVDQSKPASFLQDFHHLDHDHHHGSISSNLLLGIQTSPSCVNFSPFEHYSCQENMVDEHGPMDMEQNNTMMMMKMIPFDYPPRGITKPINFVMPYEVSCVSADNDSYKAMSLNKTKPSLTRKLSSSSSSSLCKGKEKTTLIKGQWTSEEDRFVINIIDQYCIHYNILVLLE